MLPVPERILLKGLLDENLKHAKITSVLRHSADHSNNTLRTFKLKSICIIFFGYYILGNAFIFITTW